MALTQSYSALLKRYMPEKLLQNEFAKRNYLWSKIKKDANWHGGVYEVPLLGAGFNSVEMGNLPAATDIGELAVGMGLISSQKTMTGAIKVRQEDLSRHVDMEASYLKIMPDKINDMIEFMQSLFTLQVLNGGYISKLTVDGTSGGVAKVDKGSIVLFKPGQKVEVVDDDTALVAGYVRTVDLNTRALTIYDARTGGSVVNLSAYTTLQNAKIRVVGNGTESFLSLKNACLSAANGGLDTIYGVNKSDYTVLQSMQFDGSGYTAATILDDLMGGLFDTQEVGRGQQNEILVDWGKFKNAVKQLESNRRFQVTDRKAGYGFQSIDILGGDGSATLTAVRGMPTDAVYYVDWSGIKFAGYDFFSRKQYNSEEFFVERATTGVNLISDIMLRGDVVINPSKVAISYNCPASTSV